MARLGIVAIFVTAGYYFMYYDNGHTIEERIVSVQGQLEAEKIKRADIEKKMKKEEEMRGNVMQLAANLELVKTKIPNEFNETEIFTIINRLSAASGVKVSVKKPSSQKEPNQKLVTGAELIEEINFDITMTGQFSSIVTFVEALSRETKIIKIRNFIIEKQANIDLTKEVVLQFAGEIVGYKQTSVAKSVPAAPTPGGPTK